MASLHLVSTFFGAALLTNGLPHFLSGVMGQPFRTPFTRRQAGGISTPTLNVLWGVVNLAAAFLLLRGADLYPWSAALAFLLGLLVTGLLLARSFAPAPGA